MSTLKVTDIQSNGTGFNDVVSFQNASGTENGALCRAFVNFDGTTGTSGQPDVTILASFNVSSVTDNGGLGDYTVTFTNAMVDANYSVVVSCKTNATNGNTFAHLGKSTDSSPSTSSFTIITMGSTNNSAIDAKFVYAAVFR